MMKKIIVIGWLSASLLLTGCLKQEETIQTQKTTQNEIVETGNISENEIKNNSWASRTSDIKSVIDNFASTHQWTVKHENKGIYDIYTTNPSGKEGNSYVVVFITKNNTLIYTNLKQLGEYEWKSSLSENLWDGFYGEDNQTYSHGAVFGSTWVGYWEIRDFVYINLQTLKKIYAEYSIVWKTSTKSFFNRPASDYTRQKLNIKATNIEDAYFEYFKESR